jgi:hypothetical protein
MELVLIKSETFYEDMTLSLVLFIYFYILSYVIHTLPFKMFGLFGTVWCKTALAEVDLSLP